MALTIIAGSEIHLDVDGFMTEFDEWTEELGEMLASNIGLELTDAHRDVMKFLRADFLEMGETPTLRRTSTAGGFSTKDLFTLFPKKPARKMSYVAGLQKPKGCI
jgi:TusE/DsrC/DsvC family sulfur relay protein